MRVSSKLNGILFLLIICTATPLLFTNGKVVNDDNMTLDADPKDWTVLVYMCGDNNLEFFALEDLNEMEAAGGTTADVNIVAMIDRCAYEYETPEYANDWSESRYYTIESDGSTTTFTSPMNVSLGEMNMGDPQTLDDFLDWGLTNYPADKTALIIWDHGGGLDGVCWDEDNGNDNLLVQEMSEALEGYHFDFLGLDACIMGQFEVLYEMRDFCDIYVSSMLNIPGDGWDYYSTFTSLIADPSMNAAELAQHACEDYVAYYSIYNVNVTLSAYNTSAFEDVDDLVDDFALTLTATLATNAEEVYEARLESNSDLFPDAMCDLPDFLTNLQSIPDPAMTAAASALDARLDEILVVSESSFVIDPYGMWFYMPAVPYEYYNDFYIYSNQSVVDTFVNEYYGLDFVSNTNWDNFLYQWKIELETVIPQISTVSPIVDTLTDGTHTYLYADLPDPGVGNAYQATLTMGSFVDFDLYIWSEEHYFGLPNGFEVYSQNINDDPEVVLFMIDDITRVFFLVHAYDGTGSFTLDLEVIEFSDDMLEENDDVTSAAPIAINTVYSLIYNDPDFFSVELTSGLAVEIFLDFDYLATDLDLFLLASDGVSYLAQSISYYADEYISYTPSYSGIFYIEVDYWSGALGISYDLEVSVSEDLVITSLSHTPYNPESGDSIIYTCYVSSMYSITEVTLSVSYDGSEADYFTMIYTGSFYAIELTPPEGTENVVYSIYVEDDQGNSVESSNKYITIKSNTAFLAFPWYLAPLILLGLASLSYFLKTKRRN